MKFLGSKTLETERLILKAQTMEEQQYLWSVLMLPDVNRFYLSVPKKYAERLKSWDTQEEYYQEEMKHANDIDVFKWSVFLKDTGKCIGRISCQESEEDNPAIRDVGWYIDPKYRGQGYGYEAAQAMMDYMFKECEIDEIRTGAAIQNPASWKIMEKYGFKRQNNTKMVEYTFVEEPVEDYQYYLTRKEYLKKQVRKMTIKENVKNVKEFNELYDAVGWGAYDNAISKQALDNTYYSVSVYDQDKIVGYGRLIGDTICFMYFHDIMVRSEYQNQKIGTMVMNKLLDKIKELKKKNPDMLVYLGASKGREGFYRHFGFIERKEAGLGAGMILNDE